MDTSSPLSKNFSTIAFNSPRFSCAVPVESKASSMNSLLTVVETFSPGSTIPPGMAQIPVSFLWIQTNSRICLPVVEFLRASPCSPCFQRVTMGSAAWLGPHFPSTPLPDTPVLPRMLRGLLLPSTRYSPSWLTLFT